MYRRVLLGVGALALATGAGIGAGSGVAAAGMPQPVTFSGPITCAAIGALSFTQPLVNGGTAQTTVKMKVGLKGCSAAAESGVTIKKGTLVAVSTATVANDCGAILLDGGLLPTMNGEIKWKASGGAAAPSTVSVTSASAFYDRDGNRVTVYGTVGSSAGSFTSESGSFTGLQSKGLGSTLDAACQSKKGLKAIPAGKVSGQVTGSITIQAG